MVGRGMCSRGCMAGGMRGNVGVSAWQERRPLQRTVHILPECILVESIFRSRSHGERTF